MTSGNKNSKQKEQTEREYSELQFSECDFTTYHLDSSSPHVSRIFSAHSLETSPEPLKSGSSLSAKRTEGTLQPRPHGRQQEKWKSRNQSYLPFSSEL